MTRRLLCVLLSLPALMLAQAASLSLTGPATVATGSPVTLTLSLVSGGGPAAVQWDMSGLPTGATVSTPIAGKFASCTATRCVLAGTGCVIPATGALPTTCGTANATAIADGPIATITYSQGTAASTATIANTLGATPAGAAATITAPTTAVTVPIQSHCDLNADGKVDSADVGLSIQAALTTTPPTAALIVGVIQEIIAANGGACLR